MSVNPPSMSRGFNPADGGEEGRRRSARRVSSVVGEQATLRVMATRPAHVTRMVPAHTDLVDLPFEEACVEIASRHRLKEPHAFQLAPGGVVHLVRLSDGEALCGRGPHVYAGAAQVTGPLTCRACVKAVARRLRRSVGRRAARVTPTR